jgi:photosystem II stability/assembly factor-like uncharacterized protein
MVALPHGVLFVGSAGKYDTYHIGVFRSEDSGKNWRQMLQGVAIYSLARDNGTGVLYAGSDSEMYRSTDNGESWVHTAVPNAPTQVIAIAVGSDHALYLATKPSRAYRSTSRGDTWVEITSVLEAGQVKSLMAAPSGIYAASTKGLYVSKNRGTTWTQLPALANMNLTFLTLSPNGMLYTGAYPQPDFLCSSDQGVTWYRSEISPPANRNYVFHLCTDSLNYLYAWASLGLYRSEDNGQTWDSIKGAYYYGYPMFTPAVSCLHSAGATLYMGVDGGPNYSYVSRSTDGGHSWSDPIGRGIGESIIRSLYVDPDQALVAATDHGLYRTHNKGVSWERLGAAQLEHVLAYVRTAGGSLFASEDTIGLFRSTDNGQTWEANDTAKGTYVEGLAATDDGSIFEVRRRLEIMTGRWIAGLFRSRTNGTTWDSIGSLNNFFNPYRGFLNMAVDHNTLYMAVDRGGFPSVPYFVDDTFPIYRSTDLGTSWSHSGAETIGFGAYVYVNPHTGTIMAGSLWSTDKGESWYRPGLVNITGKPQYVASPHALFAFAFSGPPYYSISDGETWDSIPTAEVFGGRFACGAIDSSGTLYGGSSGSYGVYRTNATLLSVDRSRTAAATGHARLVVTDYLIIPESSGETVEVFDLLGRARPCPIIRTLDGLRIDVHALPEGIYLAQGRQVTIFLKRLR